MERAGKEKAALPKPKQAKMTSFFQPCSQSQGLASQDVVVAAQNSNNNVSVAVGKKSSNPFSTGSGGAHFEQRVQAYFVALYLIGGVFPILNRSDCFKIGVQGRRSGVQTDDLVIYFKDKTQQESKILIQVKHKLTFTESDKQSSEALNQAWIDFGKNDPHVFNPSTDRIVFVTGTLSQTLIDHLKPLFEWARCSADEKDFLNHFEENAGEKKKKLESIKSIIKENDPTVTNKKLWAF